MPRPCKRTVASQESAESSAAKRKKTDGKETEERLGVQGMPNSGPSGLGGEPQVSEDLDIEADIQVQVSDAEDDILKLGQPAKGWGEVEQALPGYSKTNVRKTPQSRWYYKEKAKKVDSEGVLLKQKHGDISRVAKSCFCHGILWVIWSTVTPVCAKAKTGMSCFGMSTGSPWEATATHHNSDIPL